MLQGRHVSDVLVDDCATCGGVFVDHVGIRQLVTDYQRDRAAAVLAALPPIDGSAVARKASVRATLA